MRRMRQTHVARTTGAIGGGRSLKSLFEGNFRARLHHPHIHVVRVQARESVVEAAQ